MTGQSVKNGLKRQECALISAYYNTTMAQALGLELRFGIREFWVTEWDNEELKMILLFQV